MSEGVTVRNKTFDCDSAAAREFGLSPEAIRVARLTGRLDTVGTTSRWRRGNPRKVSMFGYDWPSRSTCASDLGCSTAAVARVALGTTTERQVENMRRRVMAWAAASEPVMPSAALMAAVGQTGGQSNARA